MTLAPDGIPILLTFAPMIDSELSRLLLRHYGIAYREEPHVFPLSALLTFLHGGIGQIPMLHGAGYRLSGPRAMIDRFEETCAAGQKLYPSPQAAADQVEADWNMFHGPLATQTATIAYYHLLPRRDIMVEPFTRGAPPWEVSALALLYPLVRGLLTLLLQLSEATAREALAQVRATFAATDARLADGRRYLVGNTLTLSDLSLATAAAPLLLLDGAASPVPPFERMPPALAAIISEMRECRTAAFVRRIFRECQDGARREPSMI